jgi:hypothetical protein
MKFLTLMFCFAFFAIAEAQENFVPPIVTWEAPAQHPYPEAVLETVVVRLSLNIDGEGNILYVDVLETPDEAYAESARKAVTNTRFGPATFDGRPVALTIEYGVVFSAEKVWVRSVEGEVRQSGIRSPLAGVLIEMYGPDDGIGYAISDEKGSFEMFNLASGLWALSASGDGLRSEAVEVEVNEGKVAKAALWMVPTKEWESGLGLHAQYRLY